MPKPSASRKRNHRSDPSVSRKRNHGASDPGPSRKRSYGTSEALGRPPSESWVEMTEIVLPQHTNAHGTVFGGVVMSWVDIAAATCALRHCRKPVVTASIDALHFLAPIRQGHIVSIKAAINYVGTTSCEVGVKVVSENPLTGIRSQTATAYLTFVALDDNGRPAAMPPLHPVTGEEKRRYAAAEIRRKSRLDLKNLLQTKETRRREA